MLLNEPFGGIIPGARGAVLAALLSTGTPMTGRQVYRLLSDDFSLWTVQQALKEFARLGLVSTETVGRAVIHRINDDHWAVGPLRGIMNPATALKETVQDAVDDQVAAVIGFGSVGRGESGPDSDVDLAVIVEPGWEGSSRLQQAVRTRLGNNCDVLAFTRAEFLRAAAEGEPVVADILADGVPLVGTIPRKTRSR